MTVKSLRAKNFLGFRDTDWMDLRHLNFIYGRNGSGKSILKQFLEVFVNGLNSSKDNNFFTLEKVPLSGAANIDDRLIFIFRLAPRAGLLPPLKLSVEDEDTKIYIDAYFVFKRDEQDLGRILLTRLDIQLSEIEEVGGSYLKSIFSAERDSSNIDWQLSSDFFNLAEAEIWNSIFLSTGFFPSLGSRIGSIQELVRKDVSEYDQENRTELKDSKDEVNYLFNFLEIVRSDILTLLGGTHFISPTSLNHFGDYQISKIKDEISEWFREEEWRNELLFAENYKSTGFANLSATIWGLQNLHTDDLVVLEHPDVFLDSKLQLALTDFLIQLSIRQEVKLVIETHSELMLLRLLKRIRQTTRKRLPSIFQNHEVELALEDTSVWVAVRDDMQYSRISYIEFNNWGELLTPWPDGFFEETFSERFS